MAKTDNLTDFMVDLADGIRAKKGTTEPINPQDFRKEIESISGGGAEGGSSIEYLDLSGASPLKEALISFCYLIKTVGFEVERPDGSSTSAGQGIAPSSNLVPTVVGMTYAEYSIITASIKAVAIDFNTVVVMHGATTLIKDVFTGAEELLNAIPRLTKEEFYKFD